MITQFIFSVIEYTTMLAAGGYMFYRMAVSDENVRFVLVSVAIADALIFAVGYAV